MGRFLIYTASELDVNFVQDVSRERPEFAPDRVFFCNIKYYY